MIKSFSKNKLVVAVLLVVLAGRSACAIDENTEDIVREAVRLSSSLLQAPEVFAADTLDKTVAKIVGYAALTGITAEVFVELTARRAPTAASMLYPFAKSVLLYRSLTAKTFATTIAKLSTHSVDEQEVAIDMVIRSILLLAEVILRSGAIYYHNEANSCPALKSRANKLALAAECAELTRLVKPRPFMGISFERVSSDGMNKEMYVQ